MSESGIVIQESYTANAKPKSATIAGEAGEQPKTNPQTHNRGPETSPDPNPSPKELSLIPKIEKLP